MAGPLTCSNWGSSPAGREKCSAGACPQPQAGQRPTLVPSHRREDRPTGAPIFIPWCAGGSRHGRLVRKYLSSATEFVILAEAGIQGRGMRGASDRKHLYRPASQILIPWCAGTSDWYESMSRTPIRDERFPPPNSSFRRSQACPVPRYGAGIQTGRGKTAVQ